MYEQWQNGSENTIGCNDCPEVISIGQKNVIEYGIKVDILLATIWILTVSTKQSKVSSSIKQG